MTDLTEGYVCASCDARPDSKCFRHGEKWLCGTCFDEARIAEKDADLAALRERLAAACPCAHLINAQLMKEKSRAESAEAEVARLREALRDLLQHVPDSLPHGNASKWVLDHAAVTAARALAEGDGNPSQML